MSKYKKPETWGITDDLANKINARMEQKPKANPLVDLMTLLTNAANEIADLEPDSKDWAGWIAYLLEALQVEAVKDRKEPGFESMLQILKTSLESRIESGKW